jgi:GNAT superfamily N-acetyltransferase
MGSEGAAGAGPVPLDPAHIKEAVDVLVRSFADDPGVRFVLPDAADRERHAPSLAQAAVRYALRRGTPLVTPGAVRGAALWFQPDAPSPTDGDLEATGLAAVPDRIGLDAWGRLRRLLEHLDALHPRYAPEPHWYLAMLGVDPVWQRRGIGEALMRPVFAAADRAGLCCYLEAPTAENARYYARRGFHVVGETAVPASDVRVWLMRREPDRQGRRSAKEIS